MRNPYILFLSLPSSLLSLVAAQCPLYQIYAAQKHEPLSGGTWNLSSARPIPTCRTFVEPKVEKELGRLKDVITDPDLYRLFKNTWPSTLDTTIAWRGYANVTNGTEEVQEAKEQSIGAIDAKGATKRINGDNFMRRRRAPPSRPQELKVEVDEPSDNEENVEEREELSFVITGDIEAMWLRDSAQQLLAYTSVLEASTSFSSLAGLFRGAINLQARYILQSPFCNAFQAPVEAPIHRKSSANSDVISPIFDYMSVFSCQWELDSLASFLSLSSAYAEATQDYAFFGKFNWTRAVDLVLETAESMMMDSYDDEGTWKHTPYTYCAPYGGTPINDCNGSPHKGNIGLVRSFHRPSDDACTYQYLIPSNMMFSAALNSSAIILDKLADIAARSTNGQLDEDQAGHVAGGGNRGNSKRAGFADRAKEREYKALSNRMRKMSLGIRSGIETYAIVRDPKYGPIYAYEIDGYGSVNMMDDPNIPSLLSAPYIGYLDRTDKVYQNTRRKILSRDNPYYAWGKSISGVGSPHTLPGRPWPMALIMAIMTSEDDEEIVRNLGDLVRSTDGLGLMHESVSAQNAGIWSRQWFSWANGLFGQMILDLEKRKPWILKMGFQDGDQRKKGSLLQLNGGS